MGKPNLVNPGQWTPFRSIPTITKLPEPVPVHVPVPEPVFRPISHKELVQRNSFYLNLACLLIIIGIGYFLYSIYLERKIFSDYLDYIRNNEQKDYPGFW